MVIEIFGHSFVVIENTPYFYFTFSNFINIWIIFDDKKFGKKIGLSVFFFLKIEFFDDKNYDTKPNCPAYIRVWIDYFNRKETLSLIKSEGAALVLSLQVLIVCFASEVNPLGTDICTLKRGTSTGTTFGMRGYLGGNRFCRKGNFH